MRLNFQVGKMRAAAVLSILLLTLSVAAAGRAARAAVTCPISAAQASRSTGQPLQRLVTSPLFRGNCWFVAPQAGNGNDPTAYDFKVSAGKVSKSTWDVTKALRAGPGSHLFRVGSGVGFWQLALGGANANAILTFPGSRGRYWQIGISVAPRLPISGARMVAVLTRLRRLPGW